MHNNKLILSVLQFGKYTNDEALRQYYLNAGSAHAHVLESDDPAIVVPAVEIPNVLHWRFSSPTNDTEIYAATVVNDELITRMREGEDISQFAADEIWSWTFGQYGEEVAVALHEACTKHSCVNLKTSVYCEPKNPVGHNFFVQASI